MQPMVAAKVNVKGQGECECADRTSIQAMQPKENNVRADASKLAAKGQGW